MNFMYIYIGFMILIFILCAKGLILQIRLNQMLVTKNYAGIEKIYLDLINNGSERDKQYAYGNLIAHYLMTCNYVKAREYLDIYKNSSFYERSTLNIYVKLNEICLLLEEKQYNEAQLLIEEMSKIHMNNEQKISLYGSIVQMKLANNELEEAKIMLNDLLKKYKNHPAINISYAELCIKQNNRNEAIKYVKIAYQNDKTKFHTPLIDKFVQDNNLEIDLT